MTDNNWYLSTIKVESQVEGKEFPCKVNKKYLFEALNYSDAETRIYKELSVFYPLMEDIDIKRKGYAGLIIGNDKERYYDVKFALITLDEKTGAEKRNMRKALVQAEGIEDAIKVFYEATKGSVTDITITSVSETQIIDVFPYNSESV